MCMSPVVSGKGCFLGLTHHLLLLQSFRTIFHTDPLASRGGVYIDIFFMYLMFCLHIYLYIICGPDAHGGQKVPNPLELQLHGKSSDLDAGNPTWAMWKSSKCC